MGSENERRDAVACFVLSGRDTFMTPYIRWFCEAWTRAGGRLKKDTWLPRRVRQIIGRMKLCFALGRRDRLLVIPASGRLDSKGWPFCWFYEIVPMVWDCWPFQERHLVNFIRRNKCRYCFCTASQTVAMIRSKCPGVIAEWIPEAVDVKAYPRGGPLKERTYDVIEYGRVLTDLHLRLREANENAEIRLFRPQMPGNACKTLDELTAAIRNAKISICFPQCDTNPQRAGNIETMTLRYWEAMLSGTLLMGRAPRELVDFCGYNPVIEFGWKGDVIGQVKRVLDEIDRYQELADRNERFARVHASWKSRIKKNPNYSARLKVHILHVTSAVHRQGGGTSEVVPLHEGRWMPRSHCLLRTWCKKRRSCRRGESKSIAFNFKMEITNGVF